MDYFWRRIFAFLLLCLSCSTIFFSIVFCIRFHHFNFVLVVWFDQISSYFIIFLLFHIIFLISRYSVFLIFLSYFITWLFSWFQSLPIQYGIINFIWRSAYNPFDPFNKGWRVLLVCHCQCFLLFSFVVFFNSQ